MNTDTVLQTKHLQKVFGAVRAVEDVSLEVKQGKVLGFLGPNGAGKTTTIGMILGLIYPTAGSVELFGQAVTPTRTAPLRRVGALVGAPSFVPYLSARENLKLAAQLHPRLPPARVDEVLELVGLREAARRSAGSFSSGMKQRLGLAMALLHQPELLVLDEPTNGMDPAGMREMRNLLRELADQGVTVMLSSHLLHEVEQACDEVVMLSKGRVVAQGEVNTLLGKQAVVRVRVDGPTEAALLLHTLPGASDIQPNGMWVTVGGVSSQAVVAHLTTHGVVPSEVSSGRPDLESLFLELTQTESQA